MRSLSEFRAGKPRRYPDQTVYAAYACGQFGLAFADLDGGTGTVCSASVRRPGPCISAPDDVPGIRRTTPPPRRWRRTSISPGGFCAHAGVEALGGEYFFLHDRHRAHRPAGHERDDALAHFRKLGASAFVKPLAGSRGDFAQVVHDGAALVRYLDEVVPVLRRDPDAADRLGNEYRVFLLDDEVLYTRANFRQPWWATA